MLATTPEYRRRLYYQRLSYGWPEPAAREYARLQPGDMAPAPVSVSALKVQAADMAPDILRTLAQIIFDDGVKPSARVMAARLVLEGVGVVGPSSDHAAQRPTINIQVNVDRGQTVSAPDAGPSMPG